MSSHFEYQGKELELFALAANWKAYIKSKLTPYFGNYVLEVGAGLGAMTRVLLHDGVERWTCLEPDSKLASRISTALSDHSSRKQIDVICGGTADLEPAPQYDTILYVDVLEHIEDDSGELRRAAAVLHEGGRLIVLSPAYNWLYTPFDRAVGHYRRYTAASLTARTPGNLQREKVFYLDSIGLLASLGNKLLLRQSLPSQSQIRFWDGTLVPLSRIVDQVIGFCSGRSVVAIWRKTRQA
jgi:2-polyprenyl-3-methyl-5-hydroxy-6-metoxy-1,4-benzoquinol methylase